MDFRIARYWDTLWTYVTGSCYGSKSHSNQCPPWRDIDSLLGVRRLLTHSTRRLWPASVPGKLSHAYTCSGTPPGKIESRAITLVLVFMLCGCSQNWCRSSSRQFCLLLKLSSTFADAVYSWPWQFSQATEIIRRRNEKSVTVGPCGACVWRSRRSYSLRSPEHPQNAEPITEPFYRSKDFLAVLSDYRALRTYHSLSPPAVQAKHTLITAWITIRTRHFGMNRLALR